MRRQSLAALADETVPFSLAASWAGAGGSRNKAHCPLGYEHPDGGAEAAMRVYRDHAYCFACQKFFTVTSLLALAWELDPEDAAAEALRRYGWKPAGYAHLWAQAARSPEPDRDALAKALVTWCRRQCPDWDERQYDDRVSGRLARCLGLLHLVAGREDCVTWLQASKTAMRSLLVLAKVTGLSLSGAPFRRTGDVKILKFRSLRELPELAGWLTFGEAAADLGVTGERMRQMAQEGKLKTARRIGRRPVGIVQESEIRSMVRSREEAADARRPA